MLSFLPTAELPADILKLEARSARMFEVWPSGLQPPLAPAR